MTVHTSQIEFAATPDAPALARRHLRVIARLWGLAADVIESAELAVSELVTNAVQHAGAPIGLTVRHADGVLRLEVTDATAVPPRRTDALTDAEHGRGLVIVAALAKQWGHTRRVGGGKAVWCELVAG